MKNNLEEEIKKFKLMVDYDPSKVLSEQPENKVIKGSVGAKIGGHKFNYFGVQRNPATAQLSFKYTKQLDKKLNTVGDVLEKMTSEIKDKSFVHLPQETKRLFAQGFYDAINDVINEGLNTLRQNGQLAKLTRYYDKKGNITDKKKEAMKGEKKTLRKLKRFFKKSQKWRFDLSDIKEDAKIEVPGDKTALDNRKTEILTEVTKINQGNALKQTILASDCTVFEGLDKNNQVYVKKINKNPLSTMFCINEKDLKNKEVTPETNESKIYYNDVVIDEIPVNYRPGKTDPAPYIKDVMTVVMDAIYKTSVTYETTKGSETKTIKEMIDCGVDKCSCVYDIYIADMKTISSASNVYNGEKLDITHKNDGTEVKKATALSGTKNNLANFKLAKERGDKLSQAVVQELNKGVVRVSNNFDWDEDFEIEYRVTDTGGTDDDHRTAEYSNRGQYAKFTLGLVIQVAEKVTSPAVNALEGTVINQMITLKFVGGKGAKLVVNASVTKGSTNKSVYLGKGKNGMRFLSQWKSNMRYNRNQRTMGGSDRRGIMSRHKLP
jgi:hypothetical protein